MSIIEKLKDPEILATLGLGDRLVGSLVVMALGIITCLLVLTIIMYALKIMKALTGAKEKPIAPPEPPTQSADNDGDVVAAITTAISVMEGGKAFYIKNIKLAPERESWSAAGRNDAFDSRKK